MKYMYLPKFLLLTFRFWYHKHVRRLANNVSTNQNLDWLDGIRFNIHISNISVIWLQVCGTFNQPVDYKKSGFALTLVLRSPDVLCLFKQCRSRSIGFWRNQLLNLHCLPFSIWIYINYLDQGIWMAENYKWVCYLNLSIIRRVK